MALRQRPEETRKRLLLKVPVLKLPARNLEACLEAVAGSNHEQRSDVVRRVLAGVYPGFDEKRAFRALVAPTLTRLHFARSAPPYFRLAPNGRIWKQLDRASEASFVSLVLFDFALVRLQLPRAYLPPLGSLRDAARELGDKMVDRVRGLDALLRYYFPKLLDSENRLPFTVARADMFTKPNDDLLELLVSSMPRSQITAIDEVRYGVMNKMLSKATIASSFVVDEWLRAAIRGGIIVASRAAFATIESLIMEGYAINTVTLRPKV